MQFEQLARLLGGTLYNTENASKTFRGVSIDSRTLNPGEVFFAIRGVRNDGHNFIAQAIDKGAAGVVTEFSYPRLGSIPGQVPVVGVHNSHEAILALAQKYRNRTQAKFVGFTGSNGKTTTKEFAFNLLNALDKDIYRSPGNLNNLYGMPLAIFYMPQNSRIALLELGISLPGEMTRLAEIVRPDVIVITNVGPTHLQFLGSVRGVARAKLELVRVASDNVPVIINADDPILTEETAKLRDHFITFGIDQKANFKPDDISTDLDCRMIVTIENNRFRLPFFGRYQVYNLLAAYAAVRTLGYSFENIDTEQITFETAPMRGQFIEHHGVTFISDCYNANPDSVKAGLKSFGAHPCEGHKIVILGDMLELGENEKEYHREIGQLLAKTEFDKIILVGSLMAHAYEELQQLGIASEKVDYFKDARTAADVLQTEFKSGDLVYVKGSRGIALEKIINNWQSRGGEA